MPDRGEIFVSATFCVFFSAFILASLAYAPQARLMPLVVGLPALLLSVMQFRQAIRRRHRAVTADAEAVQLKPIFTMLIWFAAAVLGTLALGIVPAGWLFVLCYLHFQHRSDWVVAVSISSVFIAVLYILVTVLLEIELPSGVILELINDK